MPPSTNTNRNTNTTVNTVNCHSNITEPTMPKDLRKDPLRKDLVTRNQGITMVPEAYAGSTQPAEHVGREKEKCYLWDRGGRQELKESEKMVPESYRPRDVQGSKPSNVQGDRVESAGTQTASLGMGSIFRKFQECLDSPAQSRKE